MQKYLINVEQYERQNYVSSNCNSITFINYGTAIVNIQQGIILANGQSFTIDGNLGEICIQEFLITFSGAGTNNCIVIKKNYVNS